MRKSDKTYFVIDRKKWKRGKKGSAKLFNGINGLKCCLGFYAEACGIPSQDLNQQARYEFMLDDHKCKIPKAVQENEDQFIALNDTGSVTGRRREDRLRRLFKKYGVTVSFKG